MSCPTWLNSIGMRYVSAKLTRDRRPWSVISGCTQTFHARKNPKKGLTKDKYSEAFFQLFLAPKLVKTSLSCWVSSNLNLSHGWMSTSIALIGTQKKWWLQAVQFVKPTNDFCIQTKPKKYQRTNKLDIMVTEYLSIMLQDCYKRPFFWNGFSCGFRVVLVPEPHSQTFHQLRQGVTPYHLGNKVPNETTRADASNLRDVLILLENVAVSRFLWQHGPQDLQLQNPKS